MTTTGPPPLPGQTGQRTFKVHGLDTKFYGRRRELEVLYSGLKDVVNNRVLNVVSVVGPSGLGKTRLIHEFAQFIDYESRGISLIQTDSSGDELDSSLRCTEQILRRRFKIESHYKPDECRALISQGLRPIVAADRLAAAVNQLNYLLGLPVPEHTVPESHFATSRFHSRALSTLFNLMQYDASKRPQIVIMDNFQLAPKTTKNVLDGMLSSFQSSAVLLILLSKQALEPSLFQNVELSSIELKTLGETEMKRVLRHLLRRVHELPGAVIDKTVQGAKGNPGLLEDIVRLMLQRGVIEQTEERWELRKEKLEVVKMPASIAGAAQARMEGLGPRERKVLEIASVFGPVFWFAGVLSLMRLDNKQDGEPSHWVEDKMEARLNATLLELQGRDLIDFRSDTGLPNEVAFAFLNSIEQQRLVAGIEPERRQFYHRMAGQWMSQVAPPESFQIWEVVGWHYEQGADHGRAASAIVHAAGLARGSYQNRRASDLYDRAVELYDETYASEKCQVTHAWAETAMVLGEYERAHEITLDTLFCSTVVGSKLWGGRAYHTLGVIARRRGMYERAMEYLQRAHQLFQDMGDLRGISDSLDDIGKVHWYKGAYGASREALSCFLKSLSLRRKVGEPANLALSLANIGNVHLSGAHVKEAAESFQEALLIRRKLDDQVGLATTLVGMGNVHFECGRVAYAQECWQEGLAIASKVGSRELNGVLHNDLGLAALKQENWEGAEVHLNKAYETASEIGDKRTLSACLANKARLAAVRGLFERGLTLAREAVATAEGIQGKQLIGMALRVQGEVLAAAMLSENPQDAPMNAEKETSECFQRSMNFFEEMGDTLGLAKTMRSYGQFLMERGVVNKARKLMSNADAVLAPITP